MEALKQIEKVMEGWFKQLPHLPEDWRKWLAHNAWWLNLIGLVLSAISILGIVQLLTDTSTPTWMYLDNAYKTLGIDSPFNNSWWMAAQYVSIAFMVVNTFIIANAIKPLKAMSRKGWDLSFLAMLVASSSSVVSAIVSMGALSLVGSVLGAVIGIGIGGYVLFELKPYFKKLK